MDKTSLIAVDVGNSRTKLGWFNLEGENDDRFDSSDPAQRVDTGGLVRLGRLPEPQRICALENSRPAWAQVEEFRASVNVGRCRWLIATVNRPAAEQLISWVRSHYPTDTTVLLTAVDVPIVVSVPRPEKVGIDRLLNAAAANALRSPGRPAAVADVGSATTVDLLDAMGVFRGGAIFAGWWTAARALNQFTDLLPLVEPSESSVLPRACGTDTETALRAGLFWSIVGGIRELIAQFAEEARAHPQIIVTGGGGEAIARALGADAAYVPYLTLRGAAISAR